MPTMTMRLDETDADVVRNFRLRSRCRLREDRGPAGPCNSARGDRCRQRRSLHPRAGTRAAGPVNVLPRRVQRHSPQATEENGPIRRATHYVMDRQKPRGLLGPPHPRQRPHSQPIRRVALPHRQLPRPVRHRRRLPHHRGICGWPPPTHLPVITRPHHPPPASPPVLYRHWR